MMTYLGHWAVTFLAGLVLAVIGLVGKARLHAGRDRRSEPVAKGAA